MHLGLPLTPPRGLLGHSKFETFQKPNIAKFFVNFLKRDLFKIKIVKGDNKKNL